MAPPPGGGSGLDSDDTYMFLPKVLRYLSAYDHQESHWLDWLGEKPGTTFAHGGSGFALSRATWEQSFGKSGDRENWCVPVSMWHHAHNRDVAGPTSWRSLGISV